ncbi:V-type proton ATPase subunit S1-like protein [Labeo rohita]|uniref:V-type proton ATPase subunit S1-like protein n=1 Tax=Labeo rohita TaxID=84645 RepID=A0A498N3Z0_LABRO|nr:V-type proton ATPase subunit S1-like protein [Labeo rohita]RXN26913.1 V-type proton ATPase subunit S1-like protein [Labeo rohita]
MAFTSLLLFICSIYSCYAQVPLLMWTSDGSNMPNLAQPAAGQTVSGGQLTSYLKSALSIAPHNVLLFLQDELSMDDFTMYGGVFGNKQDSAFSNLESALRTSSNPLVLPALDWSASHSILELFQGELGIPAVHIDPSTLKEIKLNAAQPFLLAVHLPYTAGDQTKELLLKNDAVIGEVLDMFKSQDVPYTAVYTGLKPSRVIEETPVMAGRSMGRSLLQAPPQASVKPPLVFNDAEGRPCILLWADTLLATYNKIEVDLARDIFNSSTNVTAGSVCNETLSRLVLNYRGVLGLQSLRLIFSMRKTFFPVSARHWSLMEQVVLEYDGQRAIFNGSGGIYSPAEYSFHCQSVSSTQSPLLVPRSATDNATQWTLSFTDFQIQGFNVTGEDFSYASDCAGFFTPGIWMGLLTSLLMVFILTYGLHMIMQVRTMDRFDDPKGPAISVPQSE